MAKKQRAASKSAPLKDQKGSPAPTAPQGPRPTWRLEEAKARFSEVVRRAHDQGPQYVTVRGREAVAIIDAAELERVLPPHPEVSPLLQSLESLHIEGLDLTRERDLGREPSL